MLNQQKSNLREMLDKTVEKIDGILPEPHFWSKT
jgi:hypothetical protein